jgi:hypothetical protein
MRTARPLFSGAYVLAALSHTLISISVVCHTVPPFCSMMRIGRVAIGGHASFHQGACQNESSKIRTLKKGRVD